VNTKPSAENCRRYAVLLLFQFRVVTASVSNKRRLCEKRLIVLSCPDARTALREATRRGRRSQFHYYNAMGGQVFFEFVGILDILHLGSECEPDEVWYEIERINQPMERREELIPSRNRLDRLAADQDPDNIGRDAKLRYGSIRIKRNKGGS
jgi:hypothetical protein